MFLIPSVVLLVASRIPVTGFMMSPAMPWAVPVKKPRKPLFLTPSIGLVMMPVMPFSIPVKRLRPAYYKPWPTF